MERMTKYNREMRRYRGAALAEAAIVLTVLMLLTLGALEYGWLFVNAQQVTNAARQGARIAILPDDNAETRARAAVTTLLTSAGLSDDSPVIDVNPTTMTVGGETVQAEVVHVAVSTQNLRLTHWDLLPVPPTIGCTVTMAKEGN